jgi:hypothetical protein
MKGLLIPAYVENITTRKDKSVKITLGTQEISQGSAGEIFSMLNNLVVAYISPKQIDQKEIDQVDKLDPELGGKTPSQRIRNVMFILWTQDNEGHKEFDTYYRAKAEIIIDNLKARIND